MEKKTKKKSKYKTKKGKLYKLTKHKNKEVWRKAGKKETECNNFLQNKIKINLKEYKRGRYKSSKQAIAVSYKQTSKKFPKCKFILR